MKKNTYLSRSWRVSLHSHPLQQNRIGSVSHLVMLQLVDWLIDGLIDRSTLTHGIRRNSIFSSKQPIKLQQSWVEIWIQPIQVIIHWLHTRFTSAESIIRKSSHSFNVVNQSTDWPNVQSKINQSTPSNITVVKASLFTHLHNRHGTGSDGFDRFLHLHQAHSAIAGDTESIVIAKAGNLHSDHGGCLQHRRAWLHQYAFIVDPQLNPIIRDGRRGGLASDGGQKSRSSIRNGITEGMGDHLAQETLHEHRGAKTQHFIGPGEERKSPLCAVLQSNHSSNYSHLIFAKRDVLFCENKWDFGIFLCSCWWKTTTILFCTIQRTIKHDERRAACATKPTLLFSIFSPSVAVFVRPTLLVLIVFMKKFNFFQISWQVSLVFRVSSKGIFQYYRVACCLLAKSRPLCPWSTAKVCPA